MIPSGYINRQPNLILVPNIIPGPNLILGPSLILGPRVEPETRAGWDPGPGPVGPGPEPVRTVSAKSGRSGSFGRHSAKETH